MERLLSTLLEEEVVHARLEYITGATLRQMAQTVGRFERALAVDGILSQSISDNLELLESSFEGPSLSFHQYQNIFQFLATNISDLARLVVLSHDQALRRILSHDSRPLQNRRLDPDALAETLLRELLTSGIGLQNLDRYVSTAVRRISTLTDRLDSDALTRMMSYDPERLVIWIHDFDSTLDNQITLGSKALSLCRLAANGHRVPRGFILSTELFRTRQAMTFKPFYQDTLLRIQRAIQELENQLGLQLGNPDSLLMLSIRSGAAISMPGQMSTFINVGLNLTLVEEFGQRTGHQWMAWDSYRRYLQSWAMSEGIVREEFDSIMSESKDRFGVDKKHELAADQMREIALNYKLRAEELGVIFQEDPFEQIVQCVFKVLDSWEAPQARDFRRYTGMAEDWGTAVVVQHMVHGNLSHDSGAGVTFTRNPQQPQSRKIRLFGDFAIRSQGEDLVGGLVFPLPISEAQRQQIPAYQGVESSLERNFPEIFAKLNEVASQLVSEHNHDDLEIEFTFVSPRGEDLFLLQKRPMITEFVDEIPQRNGSNTKHERLLGLGLGVAGGFFQGRVAIDLEQIEQLIVDSPDEPIILLRPDTVPEDLSMIVRAGGLLTARGGSTSHAAVTAKRLGKVAVVDCRTLQVIENEGIGLLGDTKLSMGDWISMDGRTGHIYRGCLLPTNKTGKTETP
jgi:pyruvate,orthophosphate dikinase